MRSAGAWITGEDEDDLRPRDPGRACRGSGRRQDERREVVGSHKEPRASGQGAGMPRSVERMRDQLDAAVSVLAAGAAYYSRRWASIMSLEQCDVYHEVPTALPHCERSLRFRRAWWRVMAKRAKLSAPLGAIGRKGSENAPQP